MLEPTTDANAVGSSTTEDANAAGSSTVETDANIGDSSTPETQEAEGDRFDKHPRFQELNQEVKNLKSKLAEFESIGEGDGVENAQPERPEPGESKGNFMDRHIARLVKAGYDEAPAREIAQTIWDMIQEGVAPLNQQMTAGMIDQRISEFRRSHSEVTKETEIEMEKQYKKFSPEMRRALARDPSGLEILLGMIRKSDTSSTSPNSKKTGQSLGKTRTTSGAPTKWTPEMVSKLSDPEYEKHREEIAKDFGVRL